MAKTKAGMTRMPSEEWPSLPRVRPLGLFPNLTSLSLSLFCSAPAADFGTGARQSSISESQDEGMDEFR